MKELINVLGFIKGKSLENDSQIEQESLTEREQKQKRSIRVRSGEALLYVERKGVIENKY